MIKNVNKYGDVNYFDLKEFMQKLETDIQNVDKRVLSIENKVAIQEEDISFLNLNYNKMKNKVDELEKANNFQLSKLIPLIFFIFLLLIIFFKLIGI